MKIADIYSALSPAKLAKFDNYLSKQVDRSTNIYKLHSFFKSAHPNLEEVSDKVLFMATYEDMPVGDELDKREANNIRKTRTTLQSYLDKFLIDDIRDVKITNLLDKAAAYSNLGLYKHMPSIFRAIESELKKSKSQDLQMFYNDYLLRSLKFHYEIINNNRGTDSGLQQLMDSLSHYLLASMLRFFSAGQNREKILNVRYQYPMSDQILAFLEATPPDQVPAFSRIYSSIWTLLKGNSSTTHLWDLMRLIEKHEDDIPLGEQRQMYGFIANYFNQLILVGEESYRKELFEIFEFTTQKEVWFSGVAFSEFVFFAVARNAVLCGRIAWAEDFVANYLSKTKKEHRESINRFVRAYIYFYKGNLDAAREAQLAQMVIEKEKSILSDKLNQFYNKTLEIQILFEKLIAQGENAKFRDKSRLSNLIDNFRLVQRRDLKKKNKKPGTLNKETIKRFSRFVSCLQRLYRQQFYQLPENRNPTILLNIKEKIMEKKPIEERQWLLKIIDNLLRGTK